MTYFFFIMPASDGFTPTVTIVVMGEVSMRGPRLRDLRFIA